MELHWAPGRELERLDKESRIGRGMKQMELPARAQHVHCMRNDYAQLGELPRVG